VRQIAADDDEADAIIAAHIPCCGDGFPPSHGQPGHSADYQRTCVRCRMPWPCDVVRLTSGTAARVSGAAVGGVAPRHSWRGWCEAHGNYACRTIG
jgi:hypothetical protein